MTIAVLHWETVDALNEAMVEGSTELSAGFESGPPAIARADAIEIVGKEPPGEDDTVVPFEDLRPEQREIAKAAIDDEYYVDWDESRSEACKEVSDVEYIEYQGTVYARLLSHADRQDPPILELQPVSPSESDRRFHLELESLRADAEDWFDRMAPTSNPVPLDQVPEEVRAAAREYDYCSFTTDLFALTISES